VFRIYDNCLASGIEAIFAFSIVLLQKNEELLLTLKFDEILTFLKLRVFERYKVSCYFDAVSKTSSYRSNTKMESSDEEEEQSERQAKYRVDEFVQDAISLKITPFTLDVYAHEYRDLVKAREAHAIEMDALRNSNRALAAKAYVLSYSSA
jgi:hypothetical protein